ncbi:hypothetical protein GE21DRAFT_1217508, partial [Neurospora crassa]
RDTIAYSSPPFVTNRHIFNPTHVASSARWSDKSRKFIHLTMIHESEYDLQTYPEAVPMSWRVKAPRNPINTKPC